MADKVDEGLDLVTGKAHEGVDLAAKLVNDGVDFVSDTTRDFKKHWWLLVLALIPVLAVPEVYNYLQGVLFAVLPFLG